MGAGERFAQAIEEGLSPEQAWQLAMADPARVTLGEPAKEAIREVTGPVARQTAVAVAVSSLMSQANVMRAQAEVLERGARSLELMAQALDDGAAGQLLVPAEPEPEPEVPGDDEQGRGELVDKVRVVDGYLRRLDGDELSAGMSEFLDEFDVRYKGSAHFVQAVNEQADAGAVLNEATVAVVARRVAELRDESGRD